MSEERFIPVGGNKLHVLIEGNADRPWITLLHGAATNLHLWDAQIAPLEKQFHILRIDVRGHGESTAEIVANSFDDLVADVIAVWDALGISKSTVMGLSLGGMTGFGIAIKHPDRIDRLIAADCRSDAPDFFAKSWVTRLQVLQEKGIDGIAEVTVPMWMAQAAKEGRTDILAGARAMIMTTSGPGYVSVATPLMALDYKKDLNKIRCPTLLIVGSLDGPHPDEMRQMAGLIPGARYAVVENAGHLSCFDQPERFNAALLEYLRSA
jgi:3-oxoadipate enol-lactonase